LPRVSLKLVALNVDDDTVGQGKGVIGEGGGKGLFFVDATSDERAHFGVFRFYGGDAAVEIGDLPVGDGGRGVAWR
jgi:hypothetical protein